MRYDERRALGEITAMTNRTPKKAAGWTSVQIYTAIVVVLIVGGQ